MFVPNYGHDQRVPCGMVSVIILSSWGGMARGPFHTSAANKSAVSQDGYAMQNIIEKFVLSQ